MYPTDEDIHTHNTYTHIHTQSFIDKHMNVHLIYTHTHTHTQTHKYIDTHLNKSLTVYLLRKYLGDPDIR